MAHENDVVADWSETGKQLLKQWLKQVPIRSIQRLDGIQALVDDWLSLIEGTAFEVLFERLNELAAEAARKCHVCSLMCEREKKIVRVRTTRRTLEVPVWRYRCRTCRTNRSPVRQWLGLESGMTTAGLDRLLTSLSTLLSFGASAAQVLEQFGHAIDRTLVERRTYAVGRDAIEYLNERRSARRNEVMDAPGPRAGVDRVFVQVDSGGVPVGRLERPAPDETDERTPVRKLPKGRRPKAKREVRVVLAWQDGTVEDKVVDLHIAPLKHPEFTGERMYCAALEAGMGDNTHVHCTCDMAPWQSLQFEEQFSAQLNHSLCADFYHTYEYLSAASKAFHSEPESAASWTAMQARRLKAGERPAILADLKTHACGKGPCPKTDEGKCTVQAAIRYLTGNGKHMDYPRFLAEGLPIGSGEVEGRIRHIVRRRLDVPGDWREENLVLLTALLTIRHSGWWDDFWVWMDQRDRKKFEKRLLGEGLNCFRGPKKPAKISNGTERLDLDDLSPMFSNVLGAANV